MSDHIAKRALCLNADRTRVVGKGDKAAAYSYKRAGESIDEADLRTYDFDPDTFTTTAADAKRQRRGNVKATLNAPNKQATTEAAADKHAAAPVSTDENESTEDTNEASE